METFSSTVGSSLKVDFPELSDVTDWSKLGVTLPDGVSYSRRTNSLYFKATSAVSGLVTVEYDGSQIREFNVSFTN
ncbi:hypothetical protein [Kosakonia phage Kc166A]|uniref:Uncharacterized protein n=1 Tax=Kosakonia phage Kc166A TaxID=2801381 RepID=A0AAE7UUU4_9CAUD|nr:hypothetical protein [Kosakonia phage Kc166A]